MKVYAGMDPALPLSEVARHAQRIERLGYDGLHVAETVHDSMAVALLALEHTTTLTVRTAVTLAFVRSPTLLAYQAWDLAQLSAGRFELGLGTQIRQNIVERYGMTWSSPIEQMADYVGALRSLFESFATGARLNHHGSHYELTRLQPYFNPGPLEAGSPPRLYLGGVGPASCRLAGAVANGFITHPTNSNPRYLEEIALPELAAGAAGAGRGLSDLEIVVGATVITGADEERLVAERERQRRLLAFLYSTPAYRRTLVLYGVEHLEAELKDLIRHDRFDDLGAVLDDDLIDALVPTGTLADLPAILLERFAGLAQGILLSVPVDPELDEPLALAIAELQAA